MNDYEECEWESEASRRATAVHLTIGMALCLGMAASVTYWMIGWYLE